MQRMLRLLWLGRASFRQALPLVRDACVPSGIKAIAGLLALLIISPLDIFSDIPVLGLLDDAALLALLCVLFVRVAGKYVEPVPVGRSNSVALRHVSP